MLALRNFFHQCRCGYDLRFDYLDQVRVCPECGRRTELSDATKKYLLRDYGVLEELAQYNAKVPSQFTTYRLNPSNSISFGKASSLAIHSEQTLVLTSTESIVVLFLGEMMIKKNIRKETFGAFTAFFTKHREALRRLT